jgi:hypothetical protein
MAKRFLDSELFKDEWFIELSSDAKLFWLYYVTNCDHAGVLKFSPRHIEFCTGIKNTETVIKELANRLVTVREGLFWMPKFIKFQYPNFPDTKMKAALSALSILQNLNIDLNSYITVSQQLPNCYGNGIGNGIGNGNVLGQFPKKENVEPLNELEISTTIDFIRLTKKMIWKPPEIIDFWEGFKIQNLTGKKFYQDRSAIIDHFRNWMKLQKQENATTKSGAANGSAKLGTSAARNEYLQSLT